MLISSPCPLSHVLAYHNEQTWSHDLLGNGETKAGWTQQGLTLGCQLLLSHHYDGGENAHPRSGSCGKIPLRFWTPGCNWQLGLVPLVLKNFSCEMLHN